MAWSHKSIVAVDVIIVVDVAIIFKNVTHVTNCFKNIFDDNDGNKPSSMTPYGVNIQQWSNCLFDDRLLSCQLDKFASDV